MKIPALTKLYQTAGTITWRAQFPSALDGQGSTYRVITRPDSDDIYVTSWVRNRRVIGARTLEQIRAGLKHANTAA